VAVTIILTLYFTYTIIWEVAGFWGCFAGTFILPIMLLVAPFIALIAFDTWVPALVIFGGILVSTSILGLADKIDDYT